jgi:uncharacterized membrane protein (UPF0182 family)
MYLVLQLLLCGGGLALAVNGFKKGRPGRIGAGVAILLLTLLFFALVAFWGEWLWFGAIGYDARFWTVVWIRAGTTLAGALLGLVGVFLLTRFSPSEQRRTRGWAMVAAALFGGVWGSQSWSEVLVFLNRVSADMAEPILGLDAGFYMFVLPLLDRLHILLLWIVLVALVAAVVSRFRWQTEPDKSRSITLRRSTEGYGDVGTRAVLVGSIALAVVVGAGALLAVFHLLYSDEGVVAGPGWTDVHVRLPAYFFVAALTIALGVLPALSAVRRRVRRWLTVPAEDASDFITVGGAWAGVLAVWVLALGVVPTLIQWVAVEPNEITFERPYIANNIRFTRHAFRLHEVEERQFPATEEFTRQMARANEHLLDDVRLWDYRALDEVYQQFQEIRLYYAFDDVDIDRYSIGDRYRQVMVSARELAPDNLPPQSQTFVNRRFKYTHGYGLTLAAVNEFTPDGLPELLVKDIPPKASHEDLAVQRPQIYYGELTREPVVANSTEKEFDHPSGDENVYVHYAGTGGVEMRNLWRKFVLGYLFNSTRFLLSSYPKADSRVMFHRQVRERVAKLAPFLKFDEDAYVVLANGRLYWIIDSYTTSRGFPYSEPFLGQPDGRYDLRWPGSVDPADATLSYFRGVNYVRNAVKAVVDAYDGSTDFYVFEPDDPVIRVWRNAFPSLFKGADEMPDGLRAHVRYPEGFLLAQGLVYAKYHMDDPAVFYNQEDLWVRATEKYYAKVQPVEPYYVMWQLPEADQVEFVLILPFTPKNRQVLIGWIAGMCDKENYGRFLAYKFPKEKRVLGPQQVETKIDQDRHLSAQLTLWDQRGSNVIRGNVLAIPIEDTLIYVEPIYLQADTAAYPELRLVAVMHGDTLSYANTFEEALEGLFTGGEADLAAKDMGIGHSAGELATQANESFENYLRLQNEQQFDQAARELRRLRDVLRQLKKLTTGPPADE